MSCSSSFDIVIVGAGLVGCSLALALQKQGLRIAVLEKNLPDFSSNHSVFRPISLAYSSVRILQTLGLWSSLAESAAPIKKVQVSEKGAFGSLCFNAKDYQLSALGQVVSFEVLHRQLYQAISQQDGVLIQPIHSLESINNETITVNTSQGLQSFHAELIVGADGSQSTVRRLLKMPSDQKDRQEVALIAKLSLAVAHQSVARERFSDAGILAVLPLLADNECGFVWTLPADQAEQVKQWDDQQLRAVISQKIGQRLPTIESLERGAMWPLKTVMVKQPISGKTILLGNAAHTIYPLAAQGFNLGLRDVAALAEVLVNALKAGKSLGDSEVLQGYYDWRVNDQKKITRLTASIAGAASLKLPLASGVRGFGLLMTDLLPPIKKRIARLTLGLSGNLPKLARGLSLW